MLSIIPAWAHHYGEFWRAIRIRNLWFVRLRYLASFTLLAFLFLGEVLLDLRFVGIQIFVLIVVSFLILLYNVVIHSVQKYVGSERDKFNCLHLSLIQMILDLIMLMVVVYYTGLIESPLYLFFIFHMIIGSLILPGHIVYLMAGLISCSFAVLTFFQRYDLINSHPIRGLYFGQHQHALTYDILFIVIFSLMLFISVYIANKIAHQLYRREQLLRLSLDKLNDAEKIKQKYTIGIVHEIKTPITAVQSILELIHQKYVGPIDEMVDKKIQRAKLRTQEALQLINNVLRISKLKLLEIRLTEEINIGEFLRKMIDTFSEEAKTKSINLLFVNLLRNEKVVKSDRMLLELVVSNLISNAIKYVDENGKVEIVLADKEEKFFIEVSDNGIGIPQNERDKIFDQFYRASNIDKRKYEGSGMGLTIVKEIVERLGGEIKVNSPSRLADNNKPGTSFEILLPYQYKPTAHNIFEVNNQDYLESKNNF
ncbi:MAG: HAMP domain-containing sensor histidine kinase [Bacteroidota bacterium]